MDFSVQKFKPLCDFFEVLMNFSRIASFCKKNKYNRYGSQFCKASFAVYATVKIESYEKM